MNLEEKLKNIKLEEVELPTHRNKLRRALLNSKTYEKKNSNFNIFRLLLKGFLYAIPIFIFFTLGIFVGINYDRPETKIYNDLNNLVLQANENLENKLAEEKNFYHILSKVKEKSETPYVYEAEYYEELYLNTRNYDQWESIYTLDDRKIDEKKSIDGKSYNCPDCEGLFNYKYELYKDQDRDEDYESYLTIFYELDNEGKIVDYNSKAVSSLNRLSSPNTYDDRKEILGDLAALDDIEFSNSYNWNGQIVYAVGYEWSYQDVLSESQYIFFDLETLDYLGYRSEQYVNEKLSDYKEIEIILEEFLDEPFDTSVDNLELVYDSSERGKGGQLNIYTEDVRQQTRYYDDNYSSFEEFVNSWERFREDNLDISFNRPAFWTIRLEEKTDFGGVYEYRSTSAGFYLRQEDNNESLNIELDAEFVESMEILDGLNIDIYKESVFEEDPQNYLDIEEFEIYETVFEYNGKTYVFAKIINPEDDLDINLDVFITILRSIELE